MVNKPGGITVSKSQVAAHFAEQGRSATGRALEYIEAWAAKVPSGTMMMLAKMKCTLADGPCGCGPETPVFKCTGPYPPVPVEILIDVLTSATFHIPGVFTTWQSAPEAIVVDSQVYVVEFVGPAKSLYIHKA